jgi:hypothetical protein
MPTVHADADLPGAGPDRVWSVLTTPGAVAAHAGHVRSVEMLPRDGGTSDRTAWRVLLNGSEVSWTQRDIHDARRSLRFEQIDGDLEDLSGQWQVAETPEGCRVSLTIAFALGVDGLAPLLEPIWGQSLQAHANALLKSLTAALREDQ